MTDDYEYFVNKRPDRTYISKSFDTWNPDEKSRIISKVIDSEELDQFVKIKDELILRISKGERQD